MPRHRRPAAVRANTETQDVGLVAIDGLRPAAPDPPPGLLAVTRDTWATFWSSPLAQLILPVDHEPIRRLFEMRDRQRRYLRVGGKEPLVRGSTGQMVINPLIKEADDLEAKIVALEDRFAGSLLARLKVGVVLGDAARSLADLNADLEDDEDLDDLLGPTVVDGRAG